MMNGKAWMICAALFVTGAAAVAEPTSDQVRAVSFLDDRTGWAVGVEGAVWRTDDGGRTWDRQIVPSIETLRDIHAIDPEQVWIVGDLGTVLVTRDGGSTWARLDIGTTLDLETIWIGREGEGRIAIRGGAELRTTDGGASWVVMPREAIERRRAIRRPMLEPDTLVRIGDVAMFNSSHYGVSGVATIVSDRVIRLSEFQSNGSAPGIDIRIGLATESRRDFAILEVIGRKSYQGASLDLQIPEGFTLDDFDTFTIWCFEFDVLIAEGRFQRP